MLPGTPSLSLLGNSYSTGFDLLTSYLFNDIPMSCHLFFFNGFLSASHFHSTSPWVAPKMALQQVRPRNKQCRKNKKRAKAKMMESPRRQPHWVTISYEVSQSHRIACDATDKSAESPFLRNRERSPCISRGFDISYCVRCGMLQQSCIGKDITL